MIIMLSLTFTLIGGLSGSLNYHLSANGGTRVFSKANNWNDPFVHVEPISFYMSKFYTTCSINSRIILTLTYQLRREAADHAVFDAYRWYGGTFYNWSTSSPVSCNISFPELLLSANIELSNETKLSTFIFYYVVSKKSSAWYFRMSPRIFFAIFERSYAIESRFS